MYEYCTAAISEYMPYFIDSVKEADEELVSDFPEETDLDVSLPDVIHFKPIPGCNIALDFRALMAGTADAYSWVSSTLQTVINKLAFVNYIYLKIKTLLDDIIIPETDTFLYSVLKYCLKDGDIGYTVSGDIHEVTYIQTITISEVEWDEYRVVGLGTALSPVENLTALDIVKIYAYWKTFVALFKLARRTGVLSIARKFFFKIMALPAALFTRYNMNRRMRKQVDAIEGSLDDDFTDVETLINDHDSSMDAQLGRILNVIGLKLTL